MKKVIQKRIVQVIQREIVEYYCDKCGARHGRYNPKETWWSSDGADKHYCKRGCKVSENQ